MRPLLLPFSLLHGPGDCVRQVVFQKPRGQGFFPLRALFSAVTRAGVVACCAGAVVSSGIVSSGCVAIVYIEGFKIYKVSARFLPDSFKISFRLANFIKAFEWIAFAVSAGVCGRWCRFKSHQVWLQKSRVVWLVLLKLDVFGRDESGIGQRQPAPAPQSKAPSKGGQLVVDDVVVLEVLLQLFDIVHLNHRAQAFAG